jgi:Helix-turn-helix domain
MTADPREAIALFRFAVISAATNPRLSPAERGQLVRELASQAHAHPDGSQWTYARVTLDRWIRAYREQGLDGLRPPPRADLGTVRRHPGVAGGGLPTPPGAAGTLCRTDRFDSESTAWPLRAGAHHP